MPCHKVHICTRMFINYNTPLTNCSTAISKSSVATPSPPRCSTGDKGFLTTSMVLVPTTYRHSSMLTELDIEVHIYLMQNATHILRSRIREHHELDVGRSFVVVQFILRRAIGDETIPPRQLQSPDHAPAPAHVPTCHLDRRACAPYSAARKSCRRSASHRPSRSVLSVAPALAPS